MRNAAQGRTLGGSSPLDEIGEDERLRVYAMTKQNYLLIVMARLLNLSVATSSMADDVKVSVTH